MALNINQLIKILGKNADDFSKIGKPGSKGYNKAFYSLKNEFNQLGAKAAKWTNAGDFSKLAEQEQISIINRYNTHIDNMNKHSNKPSIDDIKDARRHRREEIKNNGKTEAARNKAKEDLKRPVHEEAQQVDRTMTREEYKKQQSEARKKTREFYEQEDGQLSLFDTPASPEPNTTSQYLHAHQHAEYVAQGLFSLLW